MTLIFQIYNGLPTPILARGYTSPSWSVLWKMHSLSTLLFLLEEQTLLILFYLLTPMVVTMVSTSDHFRFVDKASDHSALKCTINLLYVPPATRQSQSHFDFRRVDFVFLKLCLSCISWQDLLCNCPTTDTMLTAFLDTFFRICIGCVPITKLRKRRAKNYPKHIVKLRAKCKYLKKRKHLPDDIRKWRVAQNGYMLAIQQYVNNNSGIA